MKVINLFGGPGAGKSTTAAGLFHLMKLEGYNVELVTEYAKKLTWQKRHNTLKDQFYVTAHQNHRMEILRDQVEWCITDSPLLLGIYYSPGYFEETYHPFIMDVFNSYNNKNFYIERKKKFVQTGRNQTFEEAKEVDTGVVKILENNGVPHIRIQGDEHAPQQILNEL